MNKELEALKNIRNDIIDFRDLIEEFSKDYEIVFHSSDKDYEIVLKALKRLEKFDKWVEKLIEDDNYAIQGQGWGQRKLELNELYDPQPFKTLDEWDYWSE